MFYLPNVHDCLVILFFFKVKEDNIFEDGKEEKERSQPEFKSELPVIACFTLFPLTFAEECTH